MQIKYLGDGKVEIKTKDATILLGQHVIINDFVLPGPGEYEKSGIFVEGISDRNNTIYLIKAEEINVCYLGTISCDLAEDKTKEIGDIDILFVPLGQKESQEIKKATDLVSKIDPKIVIPILFDDQRLTDFKKSEGITDDVLDVLKIKKSELPENERRNVILKAS